MATATFMTVEEFARMCTAETQDYELVEGELIPLPSANPIHADIRGRLEYVLRHYFYSNPAGLVLSEVDCQINDDTVRRPDLAIFLAGRLDGVDRRNIPLPFAPDIAVEVLFPSETALDVNRKVLQYLAGGSREVWVLDHENREIFIHTNQGIRLLRGAGAVLDTPSLPGFSAPIEKLLAGF
jgi:Uma2 family endonuclease